MTVKIELSGKGKQYGNSVPFSQKKTKKVWKPNVQKKTFVVEGKKMTLKLTAHDIRNLKKKGIIPNTSNKKSA